MVTKQIIQAEYETSPTYEEPTPILPRSATVVYKAIRKHGRITPKDLIGKTNLTPRTVRFALTYLKAHHYVTRTPCLLDMRSSYYSIKEENKQEA
jgi:DNA-binding MarR family transcriptional regulator